MKREDSAWIQRGCTREWWLGIKEEGVPPSDWRCPPLPQHERQAFLATLSRREIEEFFRDWRVWARENQLAPNWDWDTWLLKCGRGFGKTRTAVETIKGWVGEGWARRIAIVGQGEDDIRRTMIEGEALALDTPIPTPEGWRNFGDLEPGDQVFARDGSTTRVVGVTPIWNSRPCYAIVADGAAAIVADANHKWVSSSRSDRKPRRERREQIRTTEEMAPDVRLSRPDLCEFEIPMARPLDLPEADLVVPPYTLGAWLGDGDTRGQGTFTCHPKDIEVIENIRADGFEVSERVGSYAWGIKKLKVGLRALGLLGRKTIPDVYLRASAAQRMALLQGLMDTDGYVSARGQCSFDNTNHMLVLQARELLLTLGFKPGSIQSKIDLRGFKTMHRVTFTCAAGSTRPFRLRRKADRCCGARRSAGRLVRSIIKVESVPVRCIQVEHSTGTFLAGEDFVVTHNSGFLETAPSWDKPSWRPSAGGGILQWPNGCQGFVFSAADSEGLRGPQFQAGWFDEPMAVPPSHRNRTMANLEFCLRLGEHPRLILTTTPKPDVWLRKMMRDAKDPANKIAVTEGSLHDNAENLAANFRKKVERNYRGTRLGRQEIDGELLTDEEGALWTEDMLDKRRMPQADPIEFAATCDKVVVSVDPNTKNSVGSSKARKIAHAAGIIVCGKKGAKRSVIADRSTKGGPSRWVLAVVDAAIEFDADEIVVEVNQGGDMAKLLIQRELADRSMSLHVHTNFAKKSKEGRAEPVARMYERGEVIHIGPASEYELLEMQMVYLHEEDDPTGEDFDRCDAMVWGITRLGLKKKAFSGSKSGLGGIRTMGDFGDGASY